MATRLRSKKRGAIERVFSLAKTGTKTVAVHYRSRRTGATPFVSIYVYVLGFEVLRLPWRYSPNRLAAVVRANEEVTSKVPLRLVPAHASNAMRRFRSATSAPMGRDARTGSR